MIRELKRQGLSKKDIMEYLEYENKELYHLMETEKFYSNKHISRLEEENTELQERINKAIEYIEIHNLYTIHTTRYNNKKIREFVADDTYARTRLLDILKGDNNG